MSQVYSVSVILCLFFITEYTGVPFFKTNYTFFDETKTFYKHNTTPTKWCDALSMCMSEGATLAVPSSQNELDIIKGFRLQTVTEYLWIGLHNLYSLGDYLSAEGQPPAFVNWNEGQPNNSNNHCTGVQKDTKYHVAHCGRKYEFVCAMPMKKMKIAHSNPLCRTNDMEYFYSLKTDRCYKLHTTPKNWCNAFKTCASEHAKLVIINSKEEANLLQDKMLSTLSFASRNQAFIGMTNFLINTKFMTIDGQDPKDAGFNEWYSPPSNEFEFHCGSFRKSGKLNAYNCSCALPFFCEKSFKRKGCSIV